MKVSLAVQYVPQSDCASLAMLGIALRSESVGRTLCSEEFARDVESLAAYNDYLLAIKELLRDGTGQTTQQMSLAVNDNLVDRSQFCPRGSKCWNRDLRQARR